MIGNNKKNKKGITLIELLIGIGLFSLVIVAFLQLFTSAFKEQSKISSKGSLLNSASYVSEYMSRALRMAKKDSTGNCIAINTNYATTTNGIKFLNYQNECQEFLKDGEVLKVKKGSDTALPLTSSNLIVENLKFNFSGNIPNDSSQPKVTFILKLKNNEQILDIQTTISQRDLDQE